MQLLGTLTKLAMQTGEGLVGGIYKELGNFKLRANGCNHSYQTMLRTVASVLVVVCKRLQQLSNSVILSRVLVRHAKLLLCCLQGDHA